MTEEEINRRREEVMVLLVPILTSVGSSEYLVTLITRYIMAT